MRIVPVVEGHGEVAAVPILIRRIAELAALSAGLEVLPPIRVRRQRLLKPGELERAVELAGRKVQPDGGILLLLDADRDCPKELAPVILQRARSARGDRPIRVVLAKVEFESWFLAAAGSLAGRRGLAEHLTAPDDPEAISDPKRWLSDRMTGTRAYRETLDQPALTAMVDLEAARGASSFDKMWRDVRSLLEIAT